MISYYSKLFKKPAASANDDTFLYCRINIDFCFDKCALNCLLGYFY